MDVTIVIILHNRHQNIRRLTEYYKNTEASIILADSSTQKHPSESLPIAWKHIYTPDFNYTQKIEAILSEVKTKYVILCADDDFIISTAIHECTIFLNNNPEYASVQGRCVCYKKSEVITGAGINFYPIYPRLEYSYEAAEGLERLDNLLADYKSYLYAVHRTALIKDAYTGASASIQNLYLNEYNASILPIIKGKYKELPCLYQVREYAEDSDDKTAVNINTIMAAPRFKPDIDHFIDYLSSKINVWTRGKNAMDIRSRLLRGLGKLAESIEHNTNQRPTLKKRIGMLIALVPFVGKTIIETSRQRELKEQMRQIASTHRDQEALKNIRQILSGY